MLKQKGAKRLPCSGVSGERGIQTPGTDEPFTGFRVRPNRSLWHLSSVTSQIVLERRVEIMGKGRYLPVNVAGAKVGKSLEFMPMPLLFLASGCCFYAFFTLGARSFAARMMASGVGVSLLQCAVAVGVFIVSRPVLRGQKP